MYCRATWGFLPKFTLSHGGPEIQTSWAGILVMESQPFEKCFEIWNCYLLYRVFFYILHCWASGPSHFSDALLRPERLLRGDVFGCSLMFKRLWALKQDELSTEQSVCSATLLTVKQWLLFSALHSSSPPFFFFPPTKNHLFLHPYSPLLAPCHIYLPWLPVLPYFIVSQLGMGDQACWARAKAWIMAVLSPTRRDKHPV